jgi:hypothetical protein
MHSWGDAVKGRRHGGAARRFTHDAERGRLRVAQTMRKRLTVKSGPQERVARIVVGRVGVVVAIVVLTGSPGAPVAVLAALLAVAGLDLLVTGALGHCPLYTRLGHVPASVRRS